MVASRLGDRCGRAAQHIDETILYLNARNPDMDAAVARYTQPPFNVKLMGDQHNYQIAQAMTWLIGNATNEYVLFLEKDFQLVENIDCAIEQLNKGYNLLLVRDDAVRMLVLMVTAWTDAAVVSWQGW